MTSTTATGSREPRPADELAKSEKPTAIGLAASVASSDAQRAAALTGAVLAVSILLMAGSAAASSWLLSIIGGLALLTGLAMMIALRRLSLRHEERRMTRAE